MMKFKESREAVVNDILLWQKKTTQVAIKETYDLKIHPTTSFYNNQGTIHFDIPPQPKGMLSNIEIITSFRVKNGPKDLEDNVNCTIINNFANSLWELVDVKVSDRIDLTQIMRNSYCYHGFFNHILNNNPNREDFLFSTQLFKMDTGKTKAESETLVYSGDGIKNAGAVERAMQISASKKCTVTSKLYCPLISSSKCLPTNMKLRVALSRNNDQFLLMSDSAAAQVLIESVYLKVSYIRPHDAVLSLIEERLAKEPAPYFVTKPELIIRPIAQAGRIVRINHVFTDKLPNHALFCIQKSKDFEGSLSSNPYSFIPFGSFQLHINGVPYFTDPLEMNHITVGGKRHYNDVGPLLEQLYKTVGYDERGCCLVNSANIQQNFIVGVSLNNDRSSAAVGYLNPKAEASTQLEIDFGFDVNIVDDLILVVYAVYDRVIKIDSQRNIEIIE